MAKHHRSPMLAHVARTCMLMCVLVLACILLAPKGAYALSARTERPSGKNAWFYSDINPYFTQVGLAPKPTPVNGVYVTGNCTWYAWGRASEIAGEPLALGAYDPLGMYEDAKGSGRYRTGMTPAVGALCIGYSAYNPHVSVVERIVGDQVFVSESGYEESLTWPGYDKINFHYGKLESWMVGGVYGYIYVNGTDDGQDQTAWDDSTDDDGSADSDSSDVDSPDSDDPADGDGTSDGTSDGGTDTDEGTSDGDGTWGDSELDERDEYPGYDDEDEYGWYDDPYADDEVEIESETWVRYAGQNAYDTMGEVLAADGVFTSGRGGTVILATGDGYHDALAASGLAGLLHAPIVITTGDELAPQAADELERLDPETVIVAGGRMSIRSDVVSEVKDLGIEVVRVSGDAADGTAVALYEEGASAGSWGDVAIVASGAGYWDALSIASYAYAVGAPIFLTEGHEGTLSDETLEAISDGGFEKVVIAGGKNSVSEDAVDQLADIDIDDVVRLSGHDALDTSAEVAAWAILQGLGTGHLCVASSGTYHDALTAAPLAGEQGSVLVLVGPEGGYQALEAALEAGGDVEHGHVIGGRLSIPTTVWNDIVNL